MSGPFRAAIFLLAGIIPRLQSGRRPPQKRDSEVSGRFPRIIFLRKRRSRQPAALCKTRIARWTTVCQEMNRTKIIPLLYLRFLFGRRFWEGVGPKWYLIPQNRAILIIHWKSCQSTRCYGLAPGPISWPLVAAVERAKSNIAGQHI